MEVESDNEQDAQVVEAVNESTEIDVPPEIVRKVNFTAFKGARKNDSSILVKNTKKVNGIDAVDIKKYTESLAKELDESDSEDELPSVAVSNVTGLLKQSVKAGDEEKILLCLKAGIESDSIDATLSELGDKEEFRKELVLLLINLYLVKPRKRSSCITWLKRVFILYARSLSKDENIQNALSKLKTSIDIRLKTYDDLSMLREKLSLTIELISESDYKPLLFSEDPNKALEMVERPLYEINHKLQKRKLN